MSRYFRCGDPTGRCQLSKTKEIVAEKPGWTCPCANPRCAQHRETVSFFDVHKEKIKWGGIAAGALLVLLLISSLFKGDPLKGELDTLTREEAKLQERLVELESRPRTGNTTATGVMSTLGQLSNNAKTSLDKVTRALAANEPKLAEAELKNLEGYSKQAADLKQKARNPAPESGSLAADVTSLVNNFQDVQGRTEALRERALAGSNSSATQGSEMLLESILQGMGRASKLRGKGPAPAVDEIALAGAVNAIAGVLDDAKRKLAGYVPPPPPPIVLPPVQPVVRPFEPAEATLRICTTTDLADTLLGKLLTARTKGKFVAMPEQDQWFYLSSSNEKVLITRTKDSPYKDLIAGTADLVVAAGEASVADAEDFKKAFPGESLSSRTHAEVIALDAVTFPVHPESTKTVLTPQIMREQSRWIGGAVGSAEHQAAMRFKLPITSGLAERPADAVLKDREAIGAGVYHSEGANIKAKRLPFQAAPDLPQLKPSTFTVATEDYAFSFRIVACTSPRSKPGALELVRFITSDEGQKTVAEAGYVDLTLRPRTEPTDPLMLAALGEALGVAKVTSAERLSTNLRFATGQSVLDLKALADMERIPALMGRRYSHAKLVIVGFTDNTGTAEINERLAKERAEVVAVELRRSVPDVKTVGMGAQLPVGDNNTEEGKAKNRRSEVWVVVP